MGNKYILLSRLKFSSESPWPQGCHTTVKQTADCRLRWLRRRWHLTQKELAILLGDKSGTAVSRLECQERQPSLEVAFGCQVLFGVAPLDLFPSLFTEVEEHVVGRIRGLYGTLEGSRCESARVKRELCEAVFAQVEARSPNLMKVSKGNSA